MGSTEVLIYEVLAIILGVAITYLSIYAKTYLKTHTKIAGYTFDNDRVERILANAVAFVQAKLDIKAHEVAKELASSKNLNVAKSYIDKVDPKIITLYGDELDVMLTRKATQLATDGAK